MRLENKTKKELIAIIHDFERQEREIHGLLDEYQITRTSLEDGGRTTFVLYGRVLKAMRLLEKVGRVRRG